MISLWYPKLYSAPWAPPSHTSTSIHLADRPAAVTMVTGGRCRPQGSGVPPFPGRQGHNHSLGPTKNPGHCARQPTRPSGQLPGLTTSGAQTHCRRTPRRLQTSRLKRDNLYQVYKGHPGRNQYTNGLVQVSGNSMQCVSKGLTRVLRYKASMWINQYTFPCRMPRRDTYDNMLQGASFTNMV